MNEPRFLNVSFYKFTELDQLPALQKELRHEATRRGLKGSILLSREGINGFLAGEESVLRAFLEDLRRKRPGFADITPKDSFSAHIPFKRMLVKVKKEIITMGRPDLTPSRFTGKRVYPRELKQWLDEKKEFVLLDTRNTYEIDQGTFTGAVDYGIETFKEFPKALAEHQEELKDKTVVMFCTGGIRCEKATALAMEYGIKDVYQLEGGILKYFEETGGAHYRGDCFVFDGREAVDPNLTGAVDRKFKARVGRMKLYGKSSCPFTLRVRLVLDEKRMPYQWIEVDTRNPSEEFLKANPRGTVPVFVHNDLQLRESSVITQYLAEEFTHEPSLIPATAERRARMRLWTAWCEDTFNRDLHGWNPGAPEELRNKIEGHLFYLQNALMRRPYLISKELTLADLHLFPFVDQLVRRGFPLGERFQKLLTWHGSLTARYQKRVPAPAA